MEILFNCGHGHRRLGGSEKHLIDFFIFVFIVSVKPVTNPFDGPLLIGIVALKGQVDSNPVVATEIVTRLVVALVTYGDIDEGTWDAVFLRKEIFLALTFCVEVADCVACLWITLMGLIPARKQFTELEEQRAIDIETGTCTPEIAFLFMVVIEEIKRIVEISGDID